MVPSCLAGGLFTYNRPCSPWASARVPHLKQLWATQTEHTLLCYTDCLIWKSQPAGRDRKSEKPEYVEHVLHILLLLVLLLQYNTIQYNTIKVFKAPSKIRWAQKRERDDDYYSQVARQKLGQINIKSNQIKFIKNKRSILLLLLLLL